MESLPEDQNIYLPAYQILSKVIQVPKKVMVEVDKEREEEVPVLDEDGNETGEYTKVMVPYKDWEEVEQMVPTTQYYYQLDETKKAEIDEAIANPPEVKKPITVEELNNHVLDTQLMISELYEIMLGGM
jgi:hypothetical protein